MASEQDNGEESLDLAAALGAEEGISVNCFSVYIPNKDSNNAEIGNQRKWVLEAVELLAQISGGASAMPPVEGVWRNDEGGLIWEHPIVVYSFVRLEPFVKNLPRIREFLHRMGRETKQGEVAVEFGNRFYRIRKYDVG